MPAGPPGSVATSTASSEFRERVRSHARACKADRGALGRPGDVSIRVGHDRLADSRAGRIEDEPHRARQAALQVVPGERVRKAFVRAYPGGHIRLVRPAVDRDGDRRIDPHDLHEGDGLAPELAFTEGRPERQSSSILPGRIRDAREGRPLERDRLREARPDASPSKPLQRPPSTNATPGRPLTPMATRGSISPRLTTSTSVWSRPHLPSCCAGPTGSSATPLPSTAL